MTAPFSSIQWEDFKKVADEIQPDQCKVIELQKKSDVKEKIGFFIKAAKTNEVVYYQIGDGQSYQSNRDFVYSWGKPFQNGEKKTGRCICS